MRTKILDIFAKYFPFIIFAAIICGVLISIVIERVDLAIRGLIIALPAIFSSSILLIIRKKKLNDEHTEIIPLFENIDSRLLFNILYCSSFIILLLNSERPWYYFLNILLLYIVIFFQIFSRKISTNIILFELMFCMLNLIYGITLKYPFYFAGGDVFGHLYNSEVTYFSGRIVPPELDLYYHYFPLFHILMSEGAYILGLSLKTTFFIVTAPIYAISVVFIYYLFIRTTSNKQVSLLACTFYSVSPEVLYYGSYMITRVMAFFVFTAILYLIYINKPRVEFRIVVLILSVFLILVHHVSLPQIVILLIILFVCERIICKSNSFKDFLLLLNVLYLSYWFEGAYTPTKNILASHLRPDLVNNPTIKSSIMPGNEWIYLSDNVSISIFVFFSLIGIGYILWRKKYNYSYVFCLFSLITFILYVPNPLQTLWQIMTLFRFDRFILLLSPFMAYTMAIGLYVFYKTLLKINNIKFFSVLTILLLFSVFVLTSISNVEVSNDLHSQSTRRYFYDGELKGYDFVFNCIPLGSKLYSDYTSQVYFDREYNDLNSSEVPFFKSNFISSVESIPQYTGYLIFRNKQFAEVGLSFGYPSNKYLYMNNSKNSFELNNLLYRNQKIYSNSDIDLYLT